MTEGLTAPPRLRAVFDTNVLLSLWVFERSPGGSRLAALRTLVECGAVQIFSREDCLAEFARVLAYPEFGLAAALQQQIHQAYRVLLTPWQVVESASWPLPRCRDPDDQKFLELARDCGAQVLVSSDRDLLKLARHRALREHMRIVAPDRLLGELLPLLSAEMAWRTQNLDKIVPNPDESVNLTGLPHAVPC